MCDSRSNISNAIMQRSACYSLEHAVCPCPISHRFFARSMTSQDDDLLMGPVFLSPALTCDKGQRRVLAPFLLERKRKKKRSSRRSLN